MQLSTADVQKKILGKKLKGLALQRGQEVRAQVRALETRVSEAAREKRASGEVSGDKRVSGDKSRGPHERSLETRESFWRQGREQRSWVLLPGQGCRSL